MTHGVTKVISGGQTGADQGALWAARDLGLETGGWMPHGFFTERGADPELGRMFAMTEHQSVRYAPRTRVNIRNSHATLFFGNDGSPGGVLTRKFCYDLGRPFRVVAWDHHDGFTDFWNRDVSRLDYVQVWLKRHKVTVLNVAGNRESRAPGIAAACRKFLVSALSAPPPRGPD